MFVLSFCIWEDFDEFEKQIQEKAESEPNEPFSDEEIIALRAKLSSLEEELIKLHEQNTITQAELDSLKEKLSQMGQTAEFYTKKVWYRTAGSKVIDMFKSISKTPEGREFLSNTAKKLTDPNFIPE